MWLTRWFEEGRHIRKETTQTWSSEGVVMYNFSHCELGEKTRDLKYFYFKEIAPKKKKKRGVGGWSWNICSPTFGTAAGMIQGKTTARHNIDDLIAALPLFCSMKSTRYRAHVAAQQSFKVHKPVLLRWLLACIESAPLDYFKVHTSPQCALLVIT